MTNTPKILSNDLDQAPKVWEQYEKELNNPEIHDQIIEAFDKDEERQKKEIEEIKEKLFSNPNMNDQDKRNMRFMMNLVLEKKRNVLENLKKLEAINYTIDYVEVWGVKWGRRVLKNDPNWSHVLWNDLRVKTSSFKEQNEMLSKQWMWIPSKNDFIKTMKALPWEFFENEIYNKDSLLMASLYYILAFPQFGYLLGSNGEIMPQGYKWWYLWYYDENNKICGSIEYCGYYINFWDKKEDNNHSQIILPIFK